MSNITFADNNFPSLKGFASFLLENHLHDATVINLKLARQINLPLLQLFAHLSEQDFFDFAKASLVTFFNELIEQTALEQAKDSLQKWRSDTLPNIPRGGVATADLVLVYHVRKQLMLSFIDVYTTEVKEAVAIAKELDLLYAQVEQIAFGLYVDIKEEEHKRFNEKLQEQQAELEEAYEELMASREEIQQANETLREEARIRRAAEKALEKERNLLQHKNEELASALEELQAAEEQLVAVNNQLHERVEERTRELAASEHLMRVITDALPVLITYIDKDQRYRFVNKTYEDWFGIPAADMYGKRLEEVFGAQLSAVVHPDDYTRVNTNIQRALQGERLQYESTIVTKKAGTKDIVVLYIPHLVNDEVLGYFALITDVTERKQSEKELKRFKAMCEYSSDFIGITTTDGQALYVNPAGRNMVGLDSLENVQTTRLIDYFTPEDQQFIREVVLPARDNAGRWQAEVRLRNFKTGQTIPVYYNQFTIKDPDTGEILGTATVSPDLTEQKQAEEALRASEENFRVFANSIQNLAWMAEPDGNIYWYNQRWYDYTGTNLEEMRGWGWEKVHHPNYVDQVVAFVKHAWGKGETFELIFPLRRADGVYCWFLTSGYAVKDKEGKVIRWIGTNTDVTEQVEARQKLEESEKAAQALAEELAFTNKELKAASDEALASNEELNFTNQQLIQINADLDNFIYTASHDLRAPISNIEGLMRAMMRSLPEDARQQAVIVKLAGMISDSIDRFKRTINDLTQIAKVQRENPGEEAVQVDLSLIYHEVKLDLATQIEEANVNFETDLAGCNAVHFSAKNARSIVYNLLSNAIKYRSPERQLLISVFCYQEGEYQVLAVKDNGLGMNLVDENKIFAMFKRLHNHVEGSGIGLYIVKKMIENAGGRIEVQSKLDEGSIFKVYFKQALSHSSLK